MLIAAAEFKFDLRTQIVLVVERTRVIENECHFLVGFFGRYEHPLFFLENRFEAGPQLRKEVACDFLRDRFAQLHVERFSLGGGELWMSEVAFSGETEGSAVNGDINVFRKAVDEAEHFGQRCTALESQLGNAL